MRLGSTRSGSAPVSTLASALALVLALLPGPAAAQDAPRPAPRVASLNVCTDQLLLALADPDQIVGLSPYARDAGRAWVAQAGRYRILSGHAEDVLVLRPDLVVAGRFTKRATRELLRDKGLALAEFDAARTLDEARRQIRRMGDLVGRPERAAAEIARLDGALARARAAVARAPLTVLPVQRRGWVSGSDSLMSALLDAVGLANAAGRLGFRAGGFASLEAIVAVRPDLLLVSSLDEAAEDQGRAFLLHPALERLYPAGRRLVVPERLTVCGGPMLAEALDRLAAEVGRVVTPPAP